MTDITKKNAVIMTTKKNAKIKKAENEYFVVLQKLNNVVVLKLVQTMKKTVKISENIINDN